MGVQDVEVTEGKYTSRLLIKPKFSPLRFIHLGARIVTMISD